MKLTYLKHYQIDKEKWDFAVENSHNGLVYALSWFLDIVSPEWDALIVGDYEYLMPLTYRNKLGVQYLYQPIFIQQLGIFSKNNISKEIVESFITEIEKNFKFVDIQLNYANPKAGGDEFILRNTQIITISLPYETLYANYKKNHKKNLQKVSDSGLIINSEGNSSDFINLQSKMFINKGVEEIKLSDMEKLQKVIDYSMNLGLSEFYFGYLGGELCASAFFLKWQKRIIVYTALNEKGREIGAMFGLIDKYLKENAGQDFIFDFAGSNIPGVKYRNLGFGAQNEIYYRVKINNLPIPLKWIKK